MIMAIRNDVSLRGKIRAIAKREAAPSRSPADVSI